MKNLIFLFIVIFSLTVVSCETEDSLKMQIQELKAEKSKLIQDIDNLYSVQKEKTDSVDKLDNELKVLNIYKSGKTPKYILTLKLKQSHFSLDVGKHIKDAANAIEFDLPVDKEFYDKVKVGTDLVDDFRVGSFIMNGSFGSWKMKVIKKQIK